MAIIKCKMCGGDLEIAAGVTVAECEYCGTKQTLPKVNDEVVQNLFNRANNLRLKCEFDKAEQIYEKILQENDTEAEAHWGIVLCKYGIEYVEDPKTFKRIPTCHRTSYDAVATDADYLAAIENADAVQRSIYEAEAKAIDEIQKNILNIVKNEKPFDVFICYKETDENGNRTQDSVIANDIYYQLTQEGLKVFYAAITLEDKLGQEYEPYIFAALNSAKVMLVIGTKPQYFSAVWVKNEWSRFLKLMKADRSKLLIPCYKDMDAYDLPEEFSHLQAQDMSKIGFINDVVRGIKKVTVKDEPKTTAVKETMVAGNASTAPLLKRAFMFLEDGDWDSANEYCEKVLDLDPECAEAYVGKLMAELQVKKQDDLKDRAEIFDDSSNYQKAIRFANEELKSALTGYIEHINVRNVNARLEDKYAQAIAAMNGAQTEDAYLIAAGFFNAIGTYKDSAALAQECREKAECARKNEIYSRAKRLMQSDDHTKIRQAILLFEAVSGWKDADDLKAQCPERAEAARKDSLYYLCRRVFTGEVKKTEENWKAAQQGFESISGWKDADALAQQCVEQIEKLKEEQAERERKAEADRVAAERKAEADRLAAERKAKRNKKIMIITAAAFCVVIAFIIVLATVIIPNSKYNDAILLVENQQYDEAVSIFVELDGYKDSHTQLFNIAKVYYQSGRYSIAADTFIKSGTEDAQQYLKKPELAWYVVGNVISLGNYHEALEWHVLAVNGDKVLLGTTKYIDYRAIDSGSAGYDESDIYTWCNTSFINSAFTQEESQMILDSEYGKIFLFSEEERGLYYTQGVSWSQEATSYAKALQEAKGNYSAAKWGWYRCDNDYDKWALGTGDSELKYFERYIRVGMWVQPGSGD